MSKDRKLVLLALSAAALFLLTTKCAFADGAKKKLREDLRNYHVQSQVVCTEIKVSKKEAEEKRRQEALKTLPVAAKDTLPLLVQVQEKYWPDAPMRALLAAQIHKETCITFKHPKCMTSRAELKTYREWGRGFGQITTAYNKDGSVRFDTMKEVKSFLPELRQWDDAKDPYNPYYHMVAFIGKMNRLHNQVTFFDTPKQKYAGALVSYNRGYSGLISDRNVCKQTPGCNPNKWFGHVEHTSRMAKKAAKGYGYSFFEISRRYPASIMGAGANRYRAYFNEENVNLED